jgi:general secretion pathway protein D
MGGVAQPRRRYLVATGLWLLLAGCTNIHPCAGPVDGCHSPTQTSRLGSFPQTEQKDRESTGVCHPIPVEPNRSAQQANPPPASSVGGGHSRQVSMVPLDHGFPPARLRQASCPQPIEPSGFQQRPSQQLPVPLQRHPKEPAERRIQQATLVQKDLAVEKPVRARSAQLRSEVVLSQENLPAPKPRNSEPVTLHLDDVEVHKVLEILSREGSLNILVSPGVNGRVTANLHNLDPDQALDSILKLANLVKHTENGVIYVYTPEEKSKGFGENQNIGIRIYRLNYLRSADVEKMLKPFLSSVGKMTTSPPSEVGIKGAGGSGGAAGGASSGGSEGGGSPGGVGSAAGGGGGKSPTGGDSLAGGDIVVIQDQERVLQQLDRLVADLDVPPVQVVIEAVIMSVTRDKGHELGVNFGMVDTARTVLGLAGSGAALGGFSPLQVLGANGAMQGGFAADEHGLKLGMTGKDVSLFIRALEHFGKVEVLASPRLLVLNKQQAHLQLGERLGYATLSQSAVSTVQQVQFLDTGTQLRVRPFVSSDGMIRMEIHPERSSGRVVDNIPQASISEVATNVMVPDGTTLAIGGLMEEVKDKEHNGLPFLGTLPWVGVFFRNRTDSVTKTELVVLLTPHIWRPDEGSPPYPGADCQADPDPFTADERASAAVASCLALHPRPGTPKSVREIPGSDLTSRSTKGPVPELPSPAPSPP